MRNFSPYDLRAFSKHMKRYISQRRYEIDEEYRNQIKKDVSPYDLSHRGASMKRANDILRLEGKF